MLGFNKTQAQDTLGVHIPAPVQGINALDGLSSMSPLDAIYSYNLVSAQYGLDVRKGYREWVTGMTGGAVRTVMPYNDVVQSGANDELFAVTPTGIWDASASTATPTQVVTFGTATGDAGWGSWTLFTTLAGQYLIYCDEVNGYYHYNGTAWTNVTGVTGVDEDNFVQVVAWKERLWFVEKNSASAWYLVAGSIEGAATRFNFGTKFKHGGHLVGLYNWTIDGGSGVDDYLVAISSGGDVIVYKGTDPASAATFALHGQWYVGDLPAGRRVASSFGGDILLITRNGVLPLSQLVSGMVLADDSIYVTRKISQLINTELAVSQNNLGWDINLLPGNNLFLISAPKRTGYPFIQFVQNLVNKSWYIYRGLPIVSGAVYGGTFYFGDEGGKLYVHTGTLDAVNLAGTSFTAIEFSLLYSFQTFDIPARYKRIQFIRPSFISSGVPVISTKAVYDFDLSEAPAASGTPGSDSAFDSAIWDLSVWGGGEDVSNEVRGGEGLGIHAAVAIRGLATGKTTLIGTDVLFDAGGYL